MIIYWGLYEKNINFICLGLIYSAFYFSNKGEANKPFAGK